MKTLVAQILNANGEVIVNVKGRLREQSFRVGLVTRDGAEPDRLAEWEGEFDLPTDACPGNLIDPTPKPERHRLRLDDGREGDFFVTEVTCERNKPIHESQSALMSTDY